MYKRLRTLRQQGNGEYKFDMYRENRKQPLTKAIWIYYCY
nr:MAG TPA: hypothetical protein [Caudoviricetes sp.]